MKWTLRLRVLVIVVTINAAVAAVTLGVAARQFTRDADSTASTATKYRLSLLGDLVDAIEIDPLGVANVARILEWPRWSRFGDAVLRDANPVGISLNPLGAARRPVTFDSEGVMSAIRRSIESGEPIDDVAGGRVVPVVIDGETWGGCWYRLDETPPTNLVTRFFVPAFLLSTLLLSVGTYFALSRFVLAPVQEVAAGARRVADGDLSARVPEVAQDDEIADLVRAFNSMTAEVESFNARLADEVRDATEQARRAEAAAMTQRRLAAMGELAAGLAHEINNPLGGLLNAVETLQRGDFDAAKRERYLELLKGGLERIGRIVGQLLRFTPRQTNPVPLSLVGPVEDAIALVRHRAARQGVSLSLRVAGEAVEESRSAPPLPLVLGELHELGQAVLNLLANALDALAEDPRTGGRGGRVVVSLDVERGAERAPRPRAAGDAGAAARVVLRVEDDGPGCAPEDLDRALDLFFTTKDPGKGTGLGLGLVHQVVTRYGGTLELESRLGAGFVARAVFPALPTNPADAGRTDEAEA